MKINAISKGLIASLTLLGATSCINNITDEKVAETRAAKYLTGEEYLKAKEISEACPDEDDSKNLKMQYWDSLLLAQRADEAYAKGVQMVRDSAAGKKYAKPKLDVTLEYKGQGITEALKEAKQEIAKAHTGKELKELISKEPGDKAGFLVYHSAHRIHYWNKLAIQGAEREAFNRGANDERAKIATKSLEVDEVSALK